MHLEVLVWESMTWDNSVKTFSLNKNFALTITFRQNFVNLTTDLFDKVTLI